jgi:hypothetical protein
MAAYFPGTCGINYLDEIAYLDGINNVDTTIKGATNPGGMATTGTGPSAVTLRSNGIPVSTRAVANLKLLCVLFETQGEISMQARCQLDQLDYGS